MVLIPLQPGRGLCCPRQFGDGRCEPPVAFMKATAPTTEPTADELRWIRERVRCQQSRYRRWILETFCPRGGCEGVMEPAEPYAAEPDVGLKAFAGGHRCTDCGFEVED